MEIEKGRTVRIRYICRLKDGKAFPNEDKNLLQFKVGTGAIPPSMEKALVGMNPGEQRTVHVPAQEVVLFPFPKLSKPTPPGVAYDFGPGEGGDVAQALAGTRRSGELPPAGADVDFEIELLGVE
jgi:FKBP-type peptidyl-prolyl cis-trans isomerase